MLKPGDQVGPYTIVEEIGAGGMAVVYLATNPNGEKRAIKTLQFSARLDEDQVRRFQAEIQLLASIDSPHVVEFHRSGTVETGGRGSVLWVALSYLNGPTLREVVNSKGGRLPVETVLRWCIEIADGVLEAHGLGVVHRDLKPNNVAIVARDGMQVAVVFDFGIAKFRGWGMKTTCQSLQIGTVTYMAREQLTAETPDERVDVYALGMILFELFSGRHAIIENGAQLTPHEVMAQCMFREPPPLCERVPQLHESIGAVADRAVRKNRDERFANMREMKKALEAALLQEQARRRRESRPTPTPSRPKTEKLSAVEPAEPTDRLASETTSNKVTQRVDTRSFGRKLAQRAFMTAMGVLTGTVIGLVAMGVKAAVMNASGPTPHASGSASPGPTATSASASATDNAPPTAEPSVASPGPSTTVAASAVVAAPPTPAEHGPEVQPPKVRRPPAPPKKKTPDSFGKARF